jgi:hypothetical protein
VLDDTFLSSERVVLGLMKSYVQCESSPLFLLFARGCIHHCYTLADFKNPDDPHDKSFDSHPTDYPVGELEFPNSGATERYVFRLPLLPCVHGVWQCALSPHVAMLRSFL